MLRPERKSSTVAARPSRREVDPFDIVPALLQAGELCCLAERGVLAPSDRSPLSAIAELATEFCAEERALALASLQRKGLLPGGDVLRTFGSASGGAVHGRELLRALAIIARPEGRLRMGLRNDGRATSTVQLYLAGDEAAVGEVVVLPARESRTRGVALRVGPPIRRTALVSALHQNLASEVPAAPESAVALWPAIVEWLVALWPLEDRLARAREGGEVVALARRRALARLTEALGDAGRGRQVLEGLCASGVLDAADGKVRLSRTYRPWAEALLSGCGVELEASRFGATPEQDRRDHLLFLGASDNRVLCRTVPRPELMAEGMLPEGDIGDEGCLLLTHLAGDLLAARLRQLVIGDP
ncbi:MAG: hypothetical protein AAF604_10065 [Acidobacteriota bacterium]